MGNAGWHCMPHLQPPLCVGWDRAVRTLGHDSLQAMLTLIRGSMHQETNTYVSHSGLYCNALLPLSAPLPFLHIFARSAQSPRPLPTLYVSSGISETHPMHA